MTFFLKQTTMHLSRNLLTLKKIYFSFIAAVLEQTKNPCHWITAVGKANPALCWFLWEQRCRKPWHLV